jgi:hypothetical protein
MAGHGELIREGGVGDGEEGEGARLGCSWGTMGRAAMEELGGCSSARS